MQDLILSGRENAKSTLTAVILTLHVGGQQVISGYHKAVDDDTFYQDAEGHWVVSGDQAMVGKDGWVRIIGRYKNLIVRGGENISARAIEQCLNRVGRLEVIARLYLSKVPSIPLTENH